jgi:hypothetical protein
MMTRRMGFGISLVLIAGLAVVTQARAAGIRDADPIAPLAEMWKITYTNDAERLYLIQKDGKVIGTAGDEKLNGRIRRKGKTLLLTFDGEDKVERLTPGTDGRLFLEHYHPASDYPDKKPMHIGIGVRQK